MGDRRYLLTFLDSVHESYSFNWYEDEEEMREDIEDHPEWSDFDAIEIINCREVEI